MSISEFWTGLFRQRTRTAELSEPVQNSLRTLVMGHHSLYGSYLGPSRLSAGIDVAVWDFPRCSHAEDDICTAHISFIKGTLFGSEFSNTKVDRQQQDGHCRLRIGWDKT